MAVYAPPFGRRMPVDRVGEPGSPLIETSQILIEKILYIKKKPTFFGILLQ